MTKKSKLVLGDMAAWSGMLSELFRMIKDGSITQDHLKKFLNRKHPFEIKDIRQEWSDFYWRYFRLKVDFSDVTIPENPGDHDRMAFKPASVGMNRIVEALRKKGIKVYLYIEDLDKNVKDIVKRPNGNYAFLVRDRVEADEELKNLSANDLIERGINPNTLEERLILELKYFDETGKHLDIDNYTLCAGSRCSDGGVPSVYWNHTDGKVSVSYYHPGSSYGRMRAREVVSC